MARSKPISKALFKALIKKERLIAKQYGYVIRIRYVPFNWNKVKEQSLFSTARGAFFKDKKVIRITVIGRPGRGRILGSIYHEMRHLEHTIKGLFADYYHLSDAFTDALCSSYELKNIPSDLKLPSLRVAYLAELDCNRVAKQKLLPHGVYWDFKYPWWNTQTYLILAHILFSCDKASNMLEQMIANGESIIDVIELYAEINRVKKVLHQNGVNDTESFALKTAKNNFESRINDWYYGDL